MAIRDIDDDNFQAEVLDAKGPVLVDFWAEWCGPCKQMAPAIHELAEELGDKITIAKLNIEDAPMTPSKYAVRGVPTLMLFNDGQMTAMQLGAMRKDKIASWLAENGVV